MVERYEFIFVVEGESAEDLRGYHLFADELGAFRVGDGAQER